MNSPKGYRPNYSLEYLKTLDLDSLNELVERYQSAQLCIDTNKIHSFKPYPYQAEFYAAGGPHYDSNGKLLHNGYKQRYLSGGNRIG